ncbi:YkgJ family cysteine cluster protein [Thermodesulfobacteriota bacterium]
MSKIKPKKHSRPSIPISECIRCGTCCKKGGPSFHHEDKKLIDKGIILSKFLYTIREGELSYDNVKECHLPAASDIIKIKGQKDSWTCVFFNEDENECTIYDNRPLECRILTCWDTKEIEKMYSKNRLTRKDLLSSVEGLWDLIEDHQQRCAYDRLKRFANDLKANKKEDEALKGIHEIIEYDTRIRQLVAEKGGLDPAMVDFLFGRPITETIRMYGFKIARKGDKYSLVPTH